MCSKLSGINKIPKRYSLVGRIDTVIDLLHNLAFVQNPRPDVDEGNLCIHSNVICLTFFSFY